MTKGRCGRTSTCLGQHLGPVVFCVRVAALTDEVFLLGVFLPGEFWTPERSVVEWLEFSFSSFFSTRLCFVLSLSLFTRAVE